MEPECIAIARDMLDGRDVPEDLRSRLKRLTDLIQRAKPEGALRSTQVIALVVYQWQNEK